MDSKRILATLAQSMQATRLITGIGVGHIPSKKTPQAHGKQAANGCRSKGLFHQAGKTLEIGCFYLFCRVFQTLIP